MQRWPIRSLPANKNPIGTRCIQITIPDDDDWERAMYAEVTTLSQWMRWERNTGKDGKPVADRWLQALGTWSHCDGSPSPVAGMLEDFELPLRVDCDCNVFVTCCDGTEKKILTADQVADAIRFPGNDTPQPQPGGDCQTYHGTMIGSQQWLIPVPVSEGDTINIIAYSGATNQAGDVFWYGPNGLVFFAGQYQAGTGGLSMTDPVPTAFHLSMIIKVGGNYYPMIPGPFTVPSGISNEQPVLLLNTDVPGDVQGVIQFDVQVCNNDPLTWSSVLNFASNSYGSFVTVIQGNYVAGNGYEGVDLDGSNHAFIQLQIDFDSTQIDALANAYHSSGGGTGPNEGIDFQTNFCDPAYFGTRASLLNGDNVYAQSDYSPSTSQIILRVNAGTASISTLFKSLTINGTGVKPSQFP